MVKRLALFAVTFFTLLAAQAQLNEGVAYYSVTYPSLKPEMRKYLNVLPSTMVFTFRHHMFVSEVLTSGSYSRTIGDARSRDLTILAEMKGRKVMVRRSGYNYEELKPKVFVTLSNETKMIAGYRCKKADVITLDYENNTSNAVIWYCDSIGSPSFSYEQHYPQIKGLMMEYTVKQGDIEMVYTVTKVEAKPVDKNVFVIPSTGFELMTDREFMHLMNK
ncbi:MAG: hypothetical protein WC150_14140 [Bacteroidia bacterium]